MKYSTSSTQYPRRKTFQWEYIQQRSQNLQETQAGLSVANNNMATSGFGSEGSGGIGFRPRFLLFEISDQWSQLTDIVHKVGFNSWYESFGTEEQFSKGGVLWGVPKSQIPNPKFFDPLNPESQKFWPPKSQIPKNLTPQIPNPKIQAF